MDREAFMDFYSDMSDEDPEYIHEYLTAEKIDIDGLQARLLELVEKRKAELKLMKGRNFKLAYDELKRRASKLAKASSGETYGAAVSYRKLEGSSEEAERESEEESTEEAEKLRMIKQAKDALPKGEKGK